MTEKFDYLGQQLEELTSHHLLRKPICVDSVNGTEAVIDGEKKIIFCSNNYLSIAGHPKIADAVCKTVKKYGYGSSSSRLICGTTQLHLELEHAFAAFFQKESALVFPSGWTANEAVLTALPQKGDLILLDKLDHASIIDAAKNSEAEFKTYRRNTISKLENALADNSYNRKFIVTESIFSMDGDRADLNALVGLKKTHNAVLIIDEAHAVGCLGSRGAGLADELGLLEEVDIVIATMSKALGASGGVVAAPKVVVDYLINKARSFIYTTAPPPSNCAAALAALELLNTEPQRKKQLAENAAYLRTKLKKLGLNISESTNHIVPVIIGSEKNTLAVSESLYDKGFFVVAIRPPTVAPGTSRLRISLQTEHTKQQIDSLCDALAHCLKLR